MTVDVFDHPPHPDYGSLAYRLIVEHRDRLVVGERPSVGSVLVAAGRCPSCTAPLLRDGATGRCVGCGATVDTDEQR